jgi:hypothetical protein
MNIYLNSYQANPIIPMTLRPITACATGLGLSDNSTSPLLYRFIPLFTIGEGMQFQAAYRNWGNVAFRGGSVFEAEGAYDVS